MSQTNDGGDNVKSIQTAADTDEIREVIESVYDGWYANESRIDWTDFLDRVEEYGFDLGSSLDSPAIRRIKSIVKELRES